MLHAAISQDNISDFTRAFSRAGNRTITRSAKTTMTTTSSTSENPVELDESPVVYGDFLLRSKMVFI